MLNVAVLNIILMGVSLGLTLFFVRLMAYAPGWFPVGLLAGVGLMLVTLLNPRSGLYVLVYSMLLAPGFGIGQLAERTIELRLDDVFLVLVFIAWFTIATVRKETLLGLNTPLIRPMAGYIAVALLSTLFSILREDIGYRAAFFYVGKYAQYYVLYYMTFHMVKRFEDAPRYLWAGAITAVLVTLWAYRLIAAGELPYAPFNVDRGVAESANLAGYLLFIAGCGGGLALYYPNKIVKAAMVAFALAIVPVIPKAGSRATFLAAIATAAAMLLLARGRRLYLVIAGVIGFYILPTLYYGYFESAKERVEYTFSGSGEAQPIEIFGRTYTLETSAATRVRQWRRIANEFLPEHPFIGKGVTAVGLVDAQIPRVVGETGVLGFCFWAWLMYSLLVRVYRVYAQGKDPLARGLAFGFLAAYIGMLVQSLAVNTFIIIRIMEPFWFAAALLMRYYADKIAPQAEVRPDFRRAPLTARTA